MMWKKKNLLHLLLKKTTIFITGFTFPILSKSEKMEKEEKKNKVKNRKQFTLVFTTLFYSIYELIIKLSLVW